MNLCFCYDNKNGIEDQIAENTAALLVSKDKNLEVFVTQGSDNKHDIKINVTSVPSESSILEIGSKHSFSILDSFNIVKGFTKTSSPHKDRNCSITMYYNPTTFEMNKNFIIDRITSALSEAAQIIFTNELKFEEKKAIPKPAVKKEVIKEEILEEINEK
jgi:hypothetical protein